MEKLLTRKEIAEMWLNSPILKDKYLDYYCCPNCRDILINRGQFLMCNTIMQQIYRTEMEGTR